MKRHFYAKTISAALCMSAIVSAATFSGCKDDDEVKIVHDTVTVIHNNYDTIVNIQKGGDFFIVSYLSDYGTQPGSLLLRGEGKLTDKDLRPISADGHTFLGWFSDGNKVEPGFSVSSDLTLSAQWSDDVYELSIDGKSAKLEDIDDLQSGRHSIKVTGTMTHVLYSQIATAVRNNPDVQFDIDMGETDGLKVTLDTYYDIYEYEGFGNDNFSTLSNLLSIVLPKTLKKIGHYSFAGCDHLESVTIPDRVTEIEQYAFMGCCFDDLSLPSSIKKIGYGAFNNCAKIKSLIIPDGVREIRLSGLKSLSSITLPESLTILCLPYCSSLSSLEVPESVIILDLYECYSLSSLNLPDGLEDFSFSGSKN